MMGTDQRDLFVPLLRETIDGCVQPGNHVLDLGGGDGLAQASEYVTVRIPGLAPLGLEAIHTRR